MEEIKEEMKKVSGPPQISLAILFLKTVVGVIGGLSGTLIMLLIFVLASSILTPISDVEQLEKFVSPIFIFVLMVMMFLASTAGNILSVLLLAIVEKDRYKRLSSTIYQIFISSIIIFVLILPVYFIAASVSPAATAYAVALHLIISAQLSALIMEIVSNYKYALLGVYATAFAIIASAGTLFVMANYIVSIPILLFAALPVIWGATAFFQGFVTMFYGWISGIYDKDFLSTQTLYGEDYGKEVEGEDESEPVIKDEAGGEFLKKI